VKNQVWIKAYNDFLTGKFSDGKDFFGNVKTAGKALIKSIPCRFYITCVSSISYILYKKPKFYIQTKAQ
jgi:hypothetical protein